ncbi:ATP-grasp domain-containing protein [Desulfoferula mesophila]|uniref:Alpha-L-glutamate ligase 2 n=1 Tax=Desulfoferula mesophila TaxID=3058419 RepID=A0AAU9EU89_9BACT|nr:putative alpha-L-glutamate ligase 2 [Desulfoferula mesophilus]
MRLAVISVQGKDYHPNRRLIEAARSRGLSLELLHPFHTWCALTGEGAGLLEGRPAPTLAFPRVGSTISPYTLLLLRHLELLGCRLVNRPAAVETASFKDRCLQTLSAAGIKVPDTVFINRPQAWAAAVERLGGYPLVAKLPQGRQGRGVALLLGEAEADLARRLWLRQRRGILLQRYLPPQDRRDIRVLVVGGRAAAAVELTPPPGEFRANVHLGGRARSLETDGEAGRLAVRAAQALGLEVAGVDLVRVGDKMYYAMEVNHSPGFQGLEEATGLDVAGLLLDHALKIARET